MNKEFEWIGLLSELVIESAYAFLDDEAELSHKESLFALITGIQPTWGSWNHERQEELRDKIHSLANDIPQMTEDYAKRCCCLMYALQCTQETIERHLKESDDNRIKRQVI